MFRIHMLPAQDGDCFLVETGSRPHRILIDGGRRDTAAEIESLLDALDPAERRIDLMVLTHIDEDHVAGLVKLLASPARLSVGEVWFNGLDHARRADGQRFKLRVQPEPAPAVAEREELAMLGVRSARDFVNALAVRRCSWNALLTDGVAWVEPTVPLPSVPLPEGGRITLLGPPRTKLAAFANSWKGAFERLLESEAQEATMLSGREHQLPPPRPDEIFRLALNEDAPDTSKVNGTSIVLVIEFGGRRALFAADAHPGDVAVALGRFGGEGRVRFDAVKVAHHGSARNNTSELIDRLDSPLWLISTNGAHDHPNREAIARILLAPPKGKRLLFNYPIPAKTWANACLAKHFDYEMNQPNSRGVIAVDLIAERPA